MNNIYVLYNAIEETENRFIEAKKCGLSYLASIYLHELDGMKKAFSIVYGLSATEYFIRRIDSND